MDFWRWLQQVFSNDAEKRRISPQRAAPVSSDTTNYEGPPTYLLPHTGLAGMIAEVLGRNSPQVGYSAPGGEGNPIPLQPLVVTTARNPEQQAIIETTSHHPQQLRPVIVSAVDAFSKALLQEDPTMSPAAARQEAISMFTEKYGLTSVDQLGSFVNDSVTQLIGGRPHMSVGNPSLNPATWIGPTPDGETYLFPRRVVLEKGMPLDDAPGVATHELAHVARLRGKLPWLNQIAAEHYHDADPRTYASHSPREYEAELFKNAVHIVHDATQRPPPEGLQHLQANIAEIEPHIPGVGQAVTRLLSEPMFSSTPVAQMYRAYVLEQIGIHRREP